MSVLVTGHRGFVGREVMRHLQSLDFPVATLTGGKGEDLRLGRPNSVERIVEEIPRVESIVHCAANLSRDLLNEDTVLTNCLGTQQVVQLACRWKTTRLIYLSSVSVYSPSKGSAIREEHPVSPADIYAASKLFGETCFLAAAELGASPLVFRVCSPIGRGMPAHRLLSRWVQKVQSGEPPDLLGRGSKVQHYIDVRDVARAVEQALRHPAVSGIFNLAGGDPLSNRELVECCLVLNPDLAIHQLSRPDPDDGQFFFYDTRRAKEALGYEPRYSIADSIKAIAQDFENSAHR